SRRAARDRAGGYRCLSQQPLGQSSSSAESRGGCGSAEAAVSAPHFSSNTSGANGRAGRSYSCPKSNAFVLSHIRRAQCPAVLHQLDSHLRQSPVEVSLHLTRRLIVRSGALAALGPVLGRFGIPSLATAVAAQPAEPGRDWRHGISLFGELKYPAGF